MKKILALLCFFFTLSSINAQTKWIKTKVGSDNITIEFPKEPKYDSKPQLNSEIYVATFGTCMFTVLVKKNIIPNAIIPNYDDFKKLPASEQNTSINNFLDKGIKQFIENSTINSSAKSIKVGRYSGKEITYSNDYSGKMNKHFTKFIVVDRNLYIVQCVYQNLSEPCENLKDKFLNSIRAN